MKRQSRDFRDYTGWTQEDFANDLRTNPRYQAFYKDYNPESIERFIESYASSKHHVYVMKSYYYKDAEHQQAQFLSSAERFLTIILQKKLFNLQCLWRSKQIDLPGIEYTKDFCYFEKHIWDCPYIEPITEEEIELATRFLLEEDDDTDEYFEEWQNYEGFKIWDNEDDEDDKNDIMKSFNHDYYTDAMPIPAFYIYYDNYFKTGHLLNLPDLRWESEKYYHDAVREENVRLHALETANQPPKKPYVPDLWAYGEDSRKFIEACEDQTTKELFELKEKQVSFRIDDGENEDLKFLIELHSKGENIALVPHTNWYDAISETANLVRRKKTAEMLPYAYEAYMFEFEDQDIPALMAERLARFKFEEKGERNWRRKFWRETMAEGRALRGD